MTHSLSCLAPVVLSHCGWLAKCLVLSSQTWGMTRLDTRCTASGVVEPRFVSMLGFTRIPLKLTVTGRAMLCGCHHVDGWCWIHCFRPLTLLNSGQLRLCFIFKMMFRLKACNVLYIIVVGSRLIDIVLSHFFVFLFLTCYYVLSPLFFRGLAAPWRV